ncbi:MAG: MBL fold metallo-hydrolase [Opitutales bacterium]
MRIHVLGTGGAFTEFLGHTAFVVEHDGFLLAIDCPDAYRQVLAKHRERSGSSLRVEDIDAWLITHLHGDHCNGLEGVAFYRSFTEQRKTTVYAAEDVAETYWRDRFNSSMGRMRHPDGHWETWQREDFFETWQLHPGVMAMVGPLEVEIRRTQHALPGTAVRITADGRSWAYSNDTAFDRGLVTWLERGALIFHETGPGNFHTPYAQLAELPAETRERMRLVHYPDDFVEAREEIRTAKPGEIYTV